MKITHYLLLAAASLSFGACNSIGGDPVTQYAYIVTLASSNENGSVMTFNAIDDSPLVTLTTTQAFSKDQIGKRIFIIYTPENSDEHAVSGPVNIVHVGATLGGGAAPLVAVADTLDNWASDNIEFMQAYRAGNYLNLGMTLTTTTDPQKFQCYVDETTLDSEYPELRIIFKVKPGYDSKSYNFFGSYNISGIWHRPNVKGVKVMWNGTDKNSVTLEKTTQIKPVEPTE